MTKSQLWHFRTTTEGKERSDATSLGVSEVTKRRSFGTSERLVPRSRSAEGRREATSACFPPREVTGGSASMYTNDERSLFVRFVQVRCSVPIKEEWP